MIMLLFPFLGWETSKAQEISADDLKFLKAEEKELVVLADSMFHAFMPEIRSDYNIKFVKRLRTALQTPNSYYYTFPTLSNYVNFLSPEAGGFRIINWNVPVTDNTLRYYGAIQLEQAGKKVAFKAVSEFPIPDELKQTFENDPELKKAFYALTPGRQRGYLLHFAQAKQASTRLSRIEKCAPQIMRGEGLNDGYKKA